MIDACCLQEVRLRVHGAWMQGIKRMRYKLWWSGKGDWGGGDGVVVKEEPWEKVVEVRMVCDRVMTLVVVLEEDVLRWIWGHAPQSGKFLEEKRSIYDELKCEWDMHSAYDSVMCLGDFNGHVGRHIDGFYGVHEGYGVGEDKLEGRMLLMFCWRRKYVIKYNIYLRGKEEGIIQYWWKWDINILCADEGRTPSAYS